MAFTSRLGTPDSKLANIQFASSGIAPIAMPQFTSKLGAYNSFLAAIEFGIGQRGSPLDQSINQTLNLTQSVVALKPTEIETVSQTLVLTQTARGFNGNKKLSQSLALSQIVASQNVLSRTATHIISFIQSASGFRILNASNIITFTDSVSVFSYKGTNDQFAMTQVVAMSWRHAESVSQTLLLTQSVTAGNAYNRNVSDVLTFNHVASAIRARFLIASNVIAFQGFGSTTKIVNPSNNLVLSQALTVHKIVSISLSHLLALRQSTIRNMVFNLTPFNVLKFNNTHPRDTQILGQHQIISVPTVFVTKPNNTVVLGTTDKAITLKRPLLGDSEGGLSKVLLQRTITGSLFTYVRKNSSRKLKYAFELPKVKALELRGFIRSSLSTPMWLHNWKGEIWYGFITNNPFTLKGKQRWGNQDGEAIDVNIEFEGVRVH